jgi:hypothetical protein
MFGFGIDEMDGCECLSNLWACSEVEKIFLDFSAKAA